LEATINPALSRLLALNAYTKNYDLGEIAQKHRQAGSNLWIIREKYLSLLTDIRVGDVELGLIRTRRDALQDELHAVYVGAPHKLRGLQQGTRSVEEVGRHDFFR
jgi:hypothetical protein